MKTSDKAGRPKSSNPCTHCVMVRFDDLEYDALQRMMERAGETVKATFIKQVIADKPFKVGSGAGPMFSRVCRKR